MSNPSLPGNISTIQTPGSDNAARTGQAVRLISAPAPIIPDQRPVTVEGDVVSVNDKGRIRIAVQEGDIIIQARPGIARQIQEGQRVRVEIPPDNYDRQARMQSLPQQSVAGEDSRTQDTPPEQRPDREGNRSEMRTQEVSTSADELARSELGRGDLARGDLARGDLVRNTTRVSEQLRPDDLREQSLPTPEPVPVLSAGGSIRLVRLSEQAAQAIVPPDTQNRAIDISSNQGGAVRAEDLTNARFLEQAVQATRNSLFQNIAQIFGAPETASAAQTEINLQGFVTASLSQAQAALAQQGPLIEFVLNLTDNTGFYRPDTSQTNPVISLGAVSSLSLDATTGATTKSSALQTRLEHQSFFLKFVSVQKGQTTMAGHVVQDTVRPSSVQSVAQKTELSVSSGEVIQSDSDSPPKNLNIIQVQTGEAIFGGLKTVQAGAAQGTAAAQANSGMQGQPTQMFQTGAAGMITAQIFGQMPDGLPVLTLFGGGGADAVGQQGLFTANIQTGGAPIGTSISLQPSVMQGLQGIEAAILSPLPSHIPQSLLPGAWPGMTELHQTLFSAGQQTGQTGAQTATNMMPNPAQPMQMTAAMMLFVAAARGGDLGLWLGDRAQNMLRAAGKTDTLEMVKTEGRGLSRIVGEGQGQPDWRVNMLPVLWDGVIHKTALWTRPEPDPDDPEGEDGKKATRFIFDLEMDRMGQVQIDGLVRPEKLDVVLRTQQTLSAAMRKSMRRGYIKALEQTSLSGELHFHGKPVDHQSINSDSKNWSDLV